MYSSCQALVMYATPGSTCQDAPVVPILKVGAVPVGDAAAVHLEPASLPEERDHQQLVERILERIDRRGAGEKVRVEGDVPAGEIRREARRLVGTRAERGCEEAKEEPLVMAIEAPRSARIEEALAGAVIRRRIEVDADHYIGDHAGRLRIDEKRGRGR